MIEVCKDILYLVKYFKGFVKKKKLYFIYGNSFSKVFF